MYKPMHSPPPNRSYADRWHARRWQRWVDAAPGAYERETREWERYAAFLSLRNNPEAPAAPPIRSNRLRARFFLDDGPRRGACYN